MGDEHRSLNRLGFRHVAPFKEVKNVVLLR
jgi:hypothetical protein